MKQLLIILSFLFLYGSVYAANPTISAGSSSSITGTNFGAHALGFSYLGDNIEAGTDGANFVATDWDVYWDTETDETAVPQYDSTKSHSGDQCIIIDYKNDAPISRYRGHFYYDYGSTLASVYLTFWVLSSEPGECVEAGGGCQWKIWRINMNPGLSATSYTNYYQNHWTDNGRENNMRKNVSTYFDFGVDHYMAVDEMVPVNGSSNKWTRIELWLIQSSINTADGTVQYWFHDPEGDVTIKQVLDRNDTNTRELDYNWRYLMFGHVSGVPNHKTYWDDVYVQEGTRARVEIGDASTWTACKHREIQKPTAWTSTNISFDLQQGSFPDDSTVYLYVVNSDGDVNANGYEITAEGGNPPTITGAEIQ